MKTSELNHIQSEVVRQVLSGDVSEDALCQALVVTRKALEKDKGDPMLTAEVISYREQAIEDAEYEWNIEGNLDQTIECLRDFWCGL